MLMPFVDVTLNSVYKKHWYSKPPGAMQSIKLDDLAGQSVRCR